MYFLISIISNPKQSQWNEQVCLVLLFHGFSIFKVREETLTLVCAHNPFCVIGGDVKKSTYLLFINFPYSNSSSQISLS